MVELLIWLDGVVNLAYKSVSYVRPCYRLMGLRRLTMVLCRLVSLIANDYQVLFVIRKVMNVIDRRSKLLVKYNKF